MINYIYNVERLLPFEKTVFFWINGCHNNFWDQFMVLYTDKYVWYPFIILMIFALIYKKSWKFILLIVFSAFLLALICDYFATEVIKPFFCRYRPSHHPDFKDLVHLVNDRRGGRYGFVSNHASNGAGIAVFTSLLFKWRYYTIMIFVWVVISMYSRIYLGVHFITDILGGFIWGSIAATFVYILFNIFQKKILVVKCQNVNNIDETHKRATLVIVAYLITLTVIFIAVLFKI